MLPFVAGLDTQIPCFNPLKNQVDRFDTFYSIGNRSWRGGNSGPVGSVFRLLDFYCLREVYPASFLFKEVR
jgi:hypothetical protein